MFNTVVEYHKKEKEKKKLDNLLIPVIATDSLGQICYKNKQAKLCIPLPRTGTSISSHLKDGDSGAGVSSELPVIIDINNKKTIFSRAIQIGGTEAYHAVWVFSPELQFLDLKELDEKKMSVFKTVYSTLFTHIDKEEEKNELWSKRYHRMSQELLKPWKGIEKTKPDFSFDLSEIVALFSEQLQRNARMMNFRTDITSTLKTPLCGYRAPVLPTVILISHILSLLLRLSKTKSCRFNAGLNDRGASFDFSTALEQSTLDSRGYSFMELAEEFRAEKLNFLIADQYAVSNGFRTVGSLEENILTLNLLIPFDSMVPFEFSQTDSVWVSEIYFKRISEKLNKYIRSVIQ